MERRILLLGLRACLSAAVVVGISLGETALAHGGDMGSGRRRRGTRRAAGRSA